MTLEIYRRNIPPVAEGGTFLFLTLLQSSDAIPFRDPAYLHVFVILRSSDRGGKRVPGNKIK